MRFLPSAGAILLTMVIWIPETLAQPEQSCQVSGRIEIEGEYRGEILVWAMRLPKSKNGPAVRVTKQELFAAAVDANRVKAINGNYELNLPPGKYSIFAFADRNRNGKWDPSLPEPLGWYSLHAAGPFASVSVENHAIQNIDFTVRAPTHFDLQPRQTTGGKLQRIHGYPVLQLSGNAQTRGFAHGKLVAPQILDFFRYYLLEDKMRSAQAYENGFAKFLETHFAYPDEFVTECKAVIEGMRSSGTRLYIPELQRDFGLIDLYAINGYIETRAMRSSCTQFAAWGSRTESTDVQGGMITGRNMDGEIDIRKVTVSHFLIFAVDPMQRNQKRYVSMMWPGFVGTISGINEDGFYTMENAGLTGPGEVVDRMVPISWTMRETLAHLGKDATPASVQEFMDQYDNAAGGVSGPGCIMLFAFPFLGQQDPAFVFEGDRFGDATRVAGEVHPRVPQALVASNHPRVYGVDQARPGSVFDRTPSYSSRWRYETGRHKLEGWHRIDKKIGTAQMQELLQSVAHGTTEYAVITRPNQREFDVSVASLKPELWDAPYRPWTRFQFDELFDVEAPAKPGAQDQVR